MRAAQYVRMSTEHQQYSIENQRAAIAEYAQEHGIEIIKTYADPARSGLDLAHRPGLRQLLEDVLSTQAGYEAILVYDVSRWGRFQDTDESAYYEFLCKKAGVRIHYCAEPFNNEEEGITVTLIKSLKRAMAGEYLRELSNKVFVGQCRIAMYGYKLGGQPGYGLRRLLVSRDGIEKGILAFGERKSIASDRVRYAPGPPEEVRVVRQIYEWFVNECLSAPKITDRLNAQGVARHPARPWNEYAVREILTNPKYMGAMVFNRMSGKLRSRRICNPPELWVMKTDSFPALVSPKVFQAAQRRFILPRYFSDQYLLDGLRAALMRHGKLSGKIVDVTASIPSSLSYARRFGSLCEAYEAIGYTENTRYARGGKCKRRFRQMRDEIRNELIDIAMSSGRRASRIKKGIRIEGLGRVHIGFASLRRDVGRIPKWRVTVRGQIGRAGDRLLVVRVAEDYKTVLDFLLRTIPANQQLTFTFSEEVAQRLLLGYSVTEAARALLAT